MSLLSWESQLASPVDDLPFPFSFLRLYLSLHFDTESSLACFCFAPSRFFLYRAPQSASACYFFFPFYRSRCRHSCFPSFFFFLYMNIRIARVPLLPGSTYPPLGLSNPILFFFFFFPFCPITRPRPFIFGRCPFSPFTPLFPLFFVPPQEPFAALRPLCILFSR